MGKFLCCWLARNAGTEEKFPAGTVVHQTHSAALGRLVELNERPARLGAAGGTGELVAFRRIV
jgi:hypothetical protein